MNAEEFESLLRQRAAVANRVAHFLAAGQDPTPDLEEWKRLDNQVAARLNLTPPWEVSE